MQADPPSASPVGVSGLDPGIDGWLTEINVRVAPLMLTATHPDIIVREAFATVGASAALAAELMRREEKTQAYGRSRTRSTDVESVKLWVR